MSETEPMSGELIQAPNRRTRLNPMRQIQVRERIRAGALVRRIQDCVEGRVSMTSIQMRGAIALLDRVLPALVRTEMIGEGGGPIDFQTTQKAVVQLSLVDEANEASLIYAKLITARAPVK